MRVAVLSLWIPMLVIACGSRFEGTEGGGGGGFGGADGGAGAGGATGPGGNSNRGGAGGVGGSSAATGGAAPTSCIQSVDARRHFTCFARADGTAWCFGSNGSDQLGDGSQTDQPTPVQVAGLTSVVQVATASRMAYALTSEGQVWGWGQNDVGQMGIGSTGPNHLTPVQVPIANVEEIAAGRGHVCSRSGAGEVHCWGWNSEGQIGNDYDGGNAESPTLVLTNARQIALGGRQSCAVREDDTVWCWGSDEAGAVGHHENPAVPGRVPGIVADKIAVDGLTACALSQGQVRCWGGNHNAELGRGFADSNEHFDPELVVGLPSIVDIFAGCKNFCAKQADGRHQCWGRAELFPNMGGDVPEPTTLPLLDDALTVALGSEHFCKATQEGLTCWGRNDRGQVGNGQQGSGQAVPELVVACPGR